MDSKRVLATISSSAKAVTAALLAVFVATALMGVGAQEALAAEKPTITVTKANTGKVGLKKGSSYTLDAKAPGAKLSYKSSKKKVVTVSKKGKLKAKKAGKATIIVTAKKGSAKATKKVKVTVLAKKKYKAVKKISAKASTNDLLIGMTSNITASFTPAKASNKNLQFASSNNSVLTVNANGTVVAKKAGTAKITVTSCANKKAQATISFTVISRNGSTDRTDDSSGVVEEQHVDYAEGVTEVDAHDASVSDDGLSATIDSDSMPDAPEEGQIVVIADEDLQGTAIKVDSVEFNDDDTYSIEGTQPSFDEVFDEVHVAGEDTYSAENVTWLAEGVEVEDVSSSSSALSTQSGEGKISAAAVQTQGTFKPGTLKFILSKKFFDDIKLANNVTVSGTGNMTIAMTPVVEYDLNYANHRVNAMKLVCSSDTKVTFDGKIEGKLEVPIGKFALGKTGFTAFVVFGVDGKISLSIVKSDKAGIDYRAGMSGLPFVRDSSFTGSLSAVGTGRLGVGAKAELGLLCFEAGKLTIEGGGRAQYSAKANGYNCADAKAWAYAEASYKVDDFIAKPIGISGTGKWEILNETNSPLLWKQHFEGDQAVDKCTHESSQSSDSGSSGGGHSSGGGSADNPDAEPHDGDIANGTYGTCDWRISADGCLIVGAGTLPADEYQGESPWPWHPYASQITSVDFSSKTKIEGSACYLFADCENLTDVSGLADWDTSTVTAMGCMFDACSSLENIDALSSWDVSGVSSFMDMSSMFDGCISLTNVDALGDWDVSNVTDFTDLFACCEALTDISGLSSWDVSSVHDMQLMFQGCEQLADIDALSGWDVSHATRMYGVFRRCLDLTDVSALSGWNVSNVTDMSDMFGSCDVADVSALSGWDVSNVTDMSYMFGGCDVADVSALSGWDVSNVTSMYHMFDGCVFADLDGLANWDVSSVTDARRMFYDCYQLANASALENWRFADSVTTTDMFGECPNLTSYPSWYSA